MTGGGALPPSPAHAYAPLPAGAPSSSLPVRMLPTASVAVKPSARGKLAKRKTPDVPAKLVKVERSTPMSVLGVRPASGEGVLVRVTASGLSVLGRVAL